MYALFAKLYLFFKTLIPLLKNFYTLKEGIYVYFVEYNFNENKFNKEGIYMNSRQQQKEQRRQLILQAALDLFIRKGYGETKIADIAKAANMSMGLLFHYFESKEKLYETLIRIGSEKLKMELNFAEASPLMIFQYVTEDIFQTINANPFAAKMFVLMENAQHLDTLPSDIKEMLAEANTLIAKSIPLIEEGQRLNEIREGNPQALAIAFWNSLQGIAQHIALQPNAPCPKAEWIIAILKK